MQQNFPVFSFGKDCIKIICTDRMIGCLLVGRDILPVTHVLRKFGDDRNGCVKKRSSLRIHEMSSEI